MRPIFPIIFCLSLLFFGGVVNAQGLPELPQQILDQLQPEINIELSPEFPKPNGQVYVSITSYSINLDGAGIIWMVNGKTKASGIGEKSISFTVGDINTTTVLEVTISTVGGSVITKTLQIRPGSIDLIWQTDALTPPFYKGKGLMSHQNRISFVAVPYMTDSNSNLIPAKNLIYKWIKNGSVEQSASGYGKNVYSFVSSIISRDLSVRVEVISTDATVKGQGFASANLIEPEIIFYKKNPLYGIEFQKALTRTIPMGAKEIEVVGMPFNFGAMSPNGADLTYKWFINGGEVKDGLNGLTRVFRVQEGTSGTANISLNIEHVGKILQSASDNFSLQF